MMHPRPLHPPPRHHAGDYLSAALSHRGPGALPYDERTKWLLRAHLIALTEVFPSLAPSSSSFTHNDGRDALLLKAQGTIPTVFGGDVYHLPIAIWLLESYPLSAPFVFLTPTHGMAVVPGHHNVDPSGHVSVPYLRSWVFPPSNLVDLVRSLSDMFGKDPPLYAVFHHPHSLGTASSTCPATVPSSQSAKPSEVRRIDVLRKSLMGKLVEKVNGDVKTRIGDDMERLFLVKAELRRREGVLAAGLSAVLEDKDLLEQRLQEFLIDADVLEKWMSKNAIKLRNAVVDVDEIFEPCNALSRQLLECSSEDLVAEDTLYALERGLQEGVLPFQSYLKSVRTLAREQFFRRALEVKIVAAQVDMQQASVAS